MWAPRILGAQHNECGGRIPFLCPGVMIRLSAWQNGLNA
jgi:hypothetical protein